MVQTRSQTNPAAPAVVSRKEYLLNALTIRRLTRGQLAKLLEEGGTQPRNPITMKEVGAEEASRYLVEVYGVRRENVEESWQIQLLKGLLQYKSLPKVLEYIRNKYHVYSWCFKAKTREGVLDEFFTKHYDQAIDAKWRVALAAWHNHK